MIASTRDFMQSCPPRIALFAQGAAALLAGLLYYIFLREPGALYGIAASSSLGLSMATHGQALAASLPSFLHVIAFICMTYAIAGPGKSSLVAATGGWFVADSLFEFAQYSPFAHWIVEHVPAWFGAFPVLENVHRHFMFGTFDPADLAAIGLGASAAWLWIASNYLTEDKKS